MNMKFKRLSVLFGSAVVGLFALSVGQAANLNLSDVPLFLNGSVAPMNMLVMGRDHKLYYEAYNDHADLDNDGLPDVGYKPGRVTYYGYFDSLKCYSYSSDTFVPIGPASNKKCGGTAWSGDWLNYVTTSRIDALRKVLYGGYRMTDTDGQTILERSYIPQDAHSWGKSYESTAHDGYDIHDYTTLSQPAANSAHLFANTTLRGDANRYPLLRVIESKQDSSGRPLKIWNWVSIERPVAGGVVVVGTSGGSEVRQTLDPAPTDYRVRVKVCDNSVGLETNCRAYENSSGGTNYKPTGLLQNFGEQDTMKFGLITGSYAKNTDGGVLRRTVGSIRDEIKSDGTFDTSVSGIIQTLDRLRTTGFNTSYAYDCGWKVSGPISAGECQMWGNPIGEMMYEAMRYFAGKGGPTTDYATSFGAGEESQLQGGGLPVATWDDPYNRVADPAPYCAKPFETVISDINPSYDSDKLPGSAFSSWTGNNGISGLDVAALGQKIWDKEIGGSKKYFIGHSLSDANADNAPTPKTVTSFGNIQGLAPEEPTKEGSYYSASVAYFGATNDLNPAKNDQFMQTFAVALASPLPRIEIPVGDRKITIVPFAKTVGGSVSGQNVSATTGFQPTNQIVDFYIDSLDATSGKFRVNYEDVEQGADHDMDAIAQYEYKVNGNGTVDVTVTSQYAAGSLIQHIGYVISGTDGKDGIYFEVRDTDTGAGSDPDYYLDTPDGYDGSIHPVPNADWNDHKELPLVHTRTFSAGSTPGADLLKDPLWYAAKWGGFKDADKDGTPNLATEWDENRDKNPDNYFLVTNALTLQDQLTKAFADILRRNSSSASASVNSGSISDKTLVYQAIYNSANWTGQLKATKVDPDTGALVGTTFWDAADHVPAATDRHIITVTDTGTAVPFEWGSIGAARQAQIIDQRTLNYIRGDRSAEDDITFRKRVNVLGDIVNSSPVFVGVPPFRYRDAGYGTFQQNNASRPGMVYAGGNDGMLHGFDKDGVETFAFIPGAVFRNLPELTKPTYTHRYYVDGTPSMGDAYYGGAWHTMLLGGLNAGGQAIYALDVTDPATFNTEASATNAFLWEFTDANDADLGYTFSRPAIVKVRTSSGLRWAAIFGNGYNNTVDDTAIGGRKSTTGNAVLYIVDIETGALIRKIDTLSGSAQDPTGGARPNGLATAAAVDLNGDNTIDYVFAGDLFGHMWKFDLNSSDPTQWNIAFGGQPLFTAKDSLNRPQPITERPEVGRGPNLKGMVVVFGTGKFLEPNDKVLANLKPQTFYGLYDPDDGSAGVISSRAQLTQQQITFEDIVNTKPARKVSTNAVSGTSRGWYLDLLSPASAPPVFKGEMSVSDPILRNDSVIFATMIPSNQPCDAGGKSWLMQLNLLSGAQQPYTDYAGQGDPEASFGKPGVIAGKGEEDYAYEAATDGETKKYDLKAGPNDRGRQSWRQLR